MRCRVFVVEACRGGAGGGDQGCSGWRGRGGFGVHKV